MSETINAEHETLQLYYGLLEMVRDKSVMLEEYARGMISAEEMHIDEIDKMLRQPGQIALSDEAAEIEG